MNAREIEQEISEDAYEEDSDTSEYRDADTGAFTDDGWKEFSKMVLADYLSDSEGK